MLRGPASTSRCARSRRRAGNLAVWRSAPHSRRRRRDDSQRGGAAASGTARLVGRRPGRWRPRPSCAVPALVDVDVPVPLPRAGPRRARRRDRRPGRLPGRQHAGCSCSIRPAARGCRSSSATAGIRSGFYVARALQSVDGETGFDVQSESGGRCSAACRAEAARARSRCVVLLSTRGLDRRGRETIAGDLRAQRRRPADRGVGRRRAVRVLGDAAGLARVRRRSSRRPPGVLAATDLRHPIFRPFGALAANLGQVRFTRPGGAARAAGTWRRGSPTGRRRCSSGAKGRGRVCCSPRTSTGAGTTFRCNPAFVPFVIEAVRYAAAIERPAGATIRSRTRRPAWRQSRAIYDARRRPPGHRQRRSAGERAGDADAGGVRADAADRADRRPAAPVERARAAGRRRGRALAVRAAADAGGARRRVVIVGRAQA